MLSSQFPLHGKYSFHLSQFVSLVPHRRADLTINPKILIRRMPSLTLLADWLSGSESIGRERDKFFQAIGLGYCNTDRSHRAIGHEASLAWKVLT